MTRSREADPGHGPHGIRALDFRHDRDVDSGAGAQEGVDGAEAGPRWLGSCASGGIGFRSLSEAIDTSTPGGRLIFHIFASLAEFVRELIVDGTQDGLAAARARGQCLGRPPALGPEQVRQARLLLARPDESVASIARLLGISRTTLYKHVPELQQGGGRAALVEAVRSEALASYDVAQLHGQTGIELRTGGHPG